MIATDGLEETLGQLLNDPASMAQMLSLARSLGLQPPDAPPGKPPAPPGKPPAPPGKPPDAPPGKPPAPPPGGAAPDLGALPDLQMMQSMMQLLQQAQHSDGRQEALFCALKPFLSPQKCEKLDRAMQIARISHLAGFALRNYGSLAQKGGK